MTKKNICVLFGGKSAEHNISLRSAKNLIASINREHFNVYLIGITRKGHWIYRPDNRLLLDGEHPNQPVLNTEGIKVCLPPQCNGRLYSLEAPLKEEVVFDVVFPMLHGPLGEDGAIQGLLKVANVPFVGPDVLGAAVGMDKDVMKSLLTAAGISIGKYRTFRSSDNIPAFDSIAGELGTPVYVKPANMGSSVGISKVDTASQWQPALEEAFKYDNKIVVEANINGKELECAVLGNAHPEASTVGEVSKEVDFYDYETKYLKSTVSKAIIPARIGEDALEAVRNTAIAAYKALQCEGLGRVDVFYTEEGEILVNEINTIPGFTNISMYPKLWKTVGLPTDQLIDKLVDLAISRHRRQEEILDATR